MEQLQGFPHNSRYYNDSCQAIDDLRHDCRRYREYRRGIELYAMRDDVVVGLIETRTEADARRQQTSAPEISVRPHRHHQGQRRQSLWSRDFLFQMTTMTPYMLIPLLPMPS